MQQEALEVVREYAQAVFRRARVPMEPLNYEVDWADQPSRHTSYPGAPRVPLPVALPDLPTLRDLFTGEHLPPPGGWSLDSLATLLRLSYGVLDRRLTVNWNQDLAKRAHFEHAVWGRGTASGGGMYPVELFLVAGPSAPLLPGVYHYGTGQHVLERLVLGDVSDTVRAAVGDPAGDADSFLVASIRFWKNSFKYNSFCYHVVTQDLGALLGSWDLLARALGVPLPRLLGFDPAPVDRLLGFDSDRESAFAVVPLHWAGAHPDGDPAADGGTGPDGGTDLDGGGRSVGHGTAGERPGTEIRVRYPAFERSRRLREFPAVTEVHRAAAAPAAPAPDALANAAPRELPGDPLDLPAPQLERLARPLSTVLATRSSSFGRFRRPPELTAAELGTTLAFATAGRHHPADVGPPGDAPALTRLWVFANHVEGLAAGTYAYCSGRHALLPAAAEPDGGMSAFLQQQYFLTNYTMGQVGAVLAIAGRLDAVLDAVGPRGYRILNAEIGAVAQRAYCAATAQRLGCGAVLGFDNVAMDEALGLTGTDERTVLFLLLGRHPDGTADLVYRL
ncbi:nitroreductase family protein [Micromonospora sp. DR5-3]|uniref:nitroreductase family protein n=1 Tax=unclassified Micromonospora TaxID=2617518 RepID=UPI0011D8301A|nr:MULTISPECIES: nitroreductase family protein [unclassified Micromonospora]MCW3817093.1 nitroreductase family protein [Micromonospora sp. DR5-3]TYC22378.1 nitroreductase [Micromonospora sp. MP36]